MYMDVPHNDRVYMYTLIHSITLQYHCVYVCVSVYVYLMNYYTTQI